MPPKSQVAAWLRTTVGWSRGSSVGLSNDDIIALCIRCCVPAETALHSDGLCRSSSSLWTRAGGVWGGSWVVLSGSVKVVGSGAV